MLSCLGGKRLLLIWWGGDGGAGGYDGGAGGDDKVHVRCLLTWKPSSLRTDLKPWLWGFNGVTKPQLTIQLINTPVWSPRCPPSSPPSPGTWPPASSRPSHTLAQPHRGLSGTWKTNTSPNISFWSVHQKIISYVVQVESWAIIETKEARLAKRCEIDILLKPQANTLAVLFQAHQPLQVSALSPPAKFSKVLFSSSNCYEGKTNLPPIPKITAPTGHHSLQSVHHYLWKHDTCQQPTVTWGLSDSFELYQDWQVTI